MLFSSTTFLLAFFPAFLATYFALPWRTARNIVLLLASLVFYAWGEPVYVFLMLGSIIANWFLALGIERTGKGMRRCTLLLLCVAANLLLLGFFKYEPFLATNINALAGAELVPVLALPLPVGISFYTLQTLTYVIDVHRGEVPAQKSLVRLGMYITMFPQLVAGPIVRYADVQEQLTNRTESLEKFAAGMRLFIIGLSKKVLLANIVAILASNMLALGGPRIGAIGAWAGLAAYTFQIFFDFSGYSDMAIGLGRMLGFDFPRNFYYPYVAQSVTDFWRRWHISLSSFFRDYVYIPLGGNRVSTGRWVLNLSVVWVLTGVWHGAAWNFVLWGVYYLMLLLLEKLVLGDALERAPRLLRHAYAILAFMFGWLLFWCEDMSLLGPYFQALFGTFGPTGTSTAWELGCWQYVPVFTLCALASTPVVPWMRSRLVEWAGGNPAKDERLDTRLLCDYDTSVLARIKVSSLRRKTVQVVLTLADAALVVLLAICVCAIASGSFNPFIYFRF